MKKKKKRIKSKRKGNKYEIKISRVLSRWFTDDGKDYFWRTSVSGGKATIDSEKKGTVSSFTGDIVFLPSPDSFALWIDTKDTKKINLTTLLCDFERFIVKKWYDAELEKRDKAKDFHKKVVIIFKLYGEKSDYIFFNKCDFPAQSQQQDGECNFVVCGQYVIRKLTDFLHLCNDSHIFNSHEYEKPRREKQNTSAV